MAIVPALATKSPPDPDRIAEAQGLLTAAGFAPVQAQIYRLKRIRPRSFFGSGAVQRLGARLVETNARALFVDAPLSATQQTYLERQFGVAVYDRSGLILEIFARRARSHEGRLQVALAQAQYQRSRLKRRWTHLERQRAGSGRGFLAGPGEKQIEADRRQLDTNIKRLKRDLEGVKTRRSLQRRARRDALPLVALVGYTNAGKSTLFNRLTAARGAAGKSPVLADAGLFATLDTNLRKLTLPSGAQILLSDTVGFITDLPPELTAAFSATLEELQHASLLLRVRDGASGAQSEQSKEVERILRRLGLWGRVPLLEVANKQDLCASAPLAPPPNGVAVSALHGRGMDELLAAIDAALHEDAPAHAFALPPDASDALAWLHANGQVLRQSARAARNNSSRAASKKSSRAARNNSSRAASKKKTASKICVDVRLSARKLGAFRKQFPQFSVA